jgi:RNA polymerase sigma-70 factor (ECF subfamily)
MQPFCKLTGFIYERRFYDAQQIARYRRLCDDVLTKYSKMVYRIAFSRTKNRADSDDILQDVFMRYIKCNTHFNNEEHRKSWLIKAAVNCSKNLLNSAWFRSTTALEDTALMPFNEQDSVYPAVMELPAKYRTVIHLYYYEDLSILDISKILNTKESTVKSRMHRARNLLKVKLKGEYEDV